VARQPVRVLTGEVPEARGGKRRAVPGHARDQGGRLGDAEPQGVDRASVLVTADLRPAIGERHQERAGEQPDGDRRRGTEPRLDRALKRVADDGRGRERQRDQRDPADVEPADRFADLVAQRDQQRRGRAGVQRDLKGLAQLRIEAVVLPAEQPRDERDMTRG
jgi:hypothetical protein